jgi:acyl-CoA synthetase (AMP-forming)/AMP-acid ligase II
VDLTLPGRLATATHGRSRFIALGGATEAAVWSNATEVVGHLIPGWPSIPYGSPLPNQLHRVVDGQGRDRPDWAAGELWIGGVGVATGYRGEPETTADRFVEFEGNRWYRTGDLVRYRPGGLLEFLGRIDHQVEVHGNRIEPGEVEVALREVQDIAHAAVVAVGQHLGRNLLAFLVPHEGAILDLQNVRRHMAESLPSYMHPSRYLVVQDLPLNRNGKIDRSALAQWAAPDDDPDPGEPPRPGWEQAIAAEWNLLLEENARGRNDNFFALGGNSLLATRLASTLREKYGITDGVAALFRSPTIAEMAELIAAAARPSDSQPRPAAITQ